MARIEPLSAEEAERLWQPHYSRVTNLKRTLAHVPSALHAYMEWYPLRDRAAEFLGERSTNVFVHAISTATDCLICSTFFRRLLIDSGEDPDDLVLDDREQLLAIASSSWSSSRAAWRRIRTAPPTRCFTASPHSIQKNRSCCWWRSAA
jgi:hypothetical protein